MDTLSRSVGGVIVSQKKEFDNYKSDNSDILVLESNVLSYGIVQGREADQVAVQMSIPVIINVSRNFLLKTNLIFEVWKIYYLQVYKKFRN